MSDSIDKFIEEFGELAREQHIKGVFGNPKLMEFDPLGCVYMFETDPTNKHYRIMFSEVMFYDPEEADTETIDRVVTTLGLYKPEAISRLRKIGLLDTRDYTLKIVKDPGPSNPRTTSQNLTTLKCWHSKYRLGDNNSEGDVVPPPAEAILTFNVYMLDHGQLTLSLRPFNNVWDSGLVGYMYLTEKDLRQIGGKEWNSVITGKKARASAATELEEYGNYLQGDVWGYELYENNELEDSCWGFVATSEGEFAGMKEYLPLEAQYLLQDAWDERR